jgi:chromosome segregation ATPase
MNLVGKIFVVLILVMSVVFMAFAMAGYASHKNWWEVVYNDQPTPDKPLGLAGQLREAQEYNKKLSDQAERLKQQYDAEKTAKIQAIAKLENESEVAKGELKALEAKLAALEKAKGEAEAAMNAMQAKITGDRKELELQRKTVEEAQKDRNAHFKEVVRLTEELNQAVNERDLLKKRTVELRKDLVKANQVFKQVEHEPRR